MSHEYSLNIVNVLSQCLLMLTVYTSSTRKQKSYSTKFISGRQNDTVFLFIGLSTSIAFKKQNKTKKTFKLPTVTL